MPDIRRLLLQLSTVLIWWSVPSIFLGGIGLILPWPLVRGIAVHAVVWGGIDLGLAIIGRFRAQRYSTRYPDEYRDITDLLKLRKTLLINGFLDIVYLTVGVVLIVVYAKQPFLLGNGIGVVVQAFFLLLFDFANTYRLPKYPPPWYDAAP